LVILAMFSDDFLLNHLVLKGGNALSLIYGLGSRASLDLDFSIEGDFPDIAQTEKKILRVLKDKCASAGYIVFDETFGPRPRISRPGQERWGGYQIEFKIIEAMKFERVKGDVDRVRRNAEVVGPRQMRIFRVEISKYEFCVGKVEQELDDYTIYVYTPAMIAAEKIRAICQQMADYQLRTDKAPRARDFYDIHAVLTEGNVDLGTKENLELIRNMFAAKDVPLRLIPQIRKYREFHRQDWPSVEGAVSGELRDFDFYFDFVTHQLERLESLWIE